MKKILTSLFVLALVLSLTVVPALPAAASSTTWYVVEGGAGDETGLSWTSAFADIQDAVEAARDGDMVRVAAGNYGAFSMVNKTNISIIGDAGATVVAGDWFAIDRGPIGDAWSMAAVKDSHNIIIRGIDFDGAALSELDVYREVAVGIAYVGSTGRIANVRVENTFGAELGVGVAIIGHAREPSVNLADVTVRNSMAGIIIWDAEADLDGCTITRMTGNGGFGIMDSGVGIVVGIPGDDWQGPAVAKVKGCTITDNNDIGIYVCDSSVVEAHFNNIVGNAALGVFNDGGQRVDALHNWWGHGTGPFHPTENVTGRGNAVSNNVDFRPWVVADVVTATLTADGVVNALDQADTEVWVTMRTPAATTARTLNTEAETEVDIIGATVTVAKYAENPEDAAPSRFITLGKYIDVRVADTQDVAEVEIRLHYTDAEVENVSQLYQTFFRLLWWDGTEWKQCSDTWVNTSDKYIWAKITSDTTPSLADLGGTPFGGYGSSPGVPNGCGCFISTAVYGTDAADEIDVLRDFRDAVLLPNSLGASFVSVYYSVSPPIADFISRCEPLRTLVRVGFVDPIVVVLTWSQDRWWPSNS
ncbi:MAG: right-handed parallel beta-helix repeat-containing protein [Dehalococcoidia bacterium]|nr:right-handed parallel beta-helix repeat-containing protein [Dehalococcoidia bacterium]